MKKSFAISFFIFLIQYQANSQNWNSLGGGLGNAIRAMYSDTVDNYLYATGFFYYTTTDGRRLKGIARWDGIKWDSLGAGIDGADTMALNNTFAFARYNNDLYVGGAFRSLGDKWTRGIGVWKNTYWDTLAVQPFKGKFGYAASVLTMSVINSELYIGGSFDSINNIPCRGIAKWDGSTWTCLNMPANIYGDPYVFSICEYNHEIYVGGNFSTNLVPNDTIQDIIKYDGTNWRSVGGGLKGSWSAVNAMVVYNNELYVGGYLNIADGNHGNYIQKWNGSVWTEVGGGVLGIGGSQGQITKLFLHDTKLYAIGNFETAGGIPAQYVASWDGTNWCGFGTSFDNIASQGCFYRDTLCVGGGFHTVNGDSINRIAKWMGGNYTDTCSNLSIGITEQNNFSEFLNIYPNPATDQITVELDLTEAKNTSIEINNVLGQTVKKIKNNFITGNNKIEIDVSDLSNGMYIVQLQTEKKRIGVKLLKNASN